MFFVRPTRIFFPDPSDEKLCALVPSRGHTASDAFYPATQCFPLANQVKAVPLQTFVEGVSFLKLRPQYIDLSRLNPV